MTQGQVPHLSSSSPFQPSFEYDGDTGKVKGSKTSEAHAEWVKEKAGSIQLQVMTCLSNSGMNGQTCREVEETTGLSHQSVSASLRNMELDGHDPARPFGFGNYGKVVKLETTRSNQHPYVARQVAATMRIDYLLPPTPRRVSYKNRYDSLVRDLRGLTEEMSNDYSWIWYEKLINIIDQNK
tara:strand:- start:501 stop:1046 length:546 start_codon:yes stop_codon:yes gene_type:complete